MNQTTCYSKKSEIDFCCDCYGSAWLPHFQNTFTRLSSVCYFVQNLVWDSDQCNNTNGFVHYEYFIDSTSVAPIEYLLLMQVP